MVSGCGGNDGGPDTGSLVLRTTTTGEGLDQNGYTVRVDAQTPVAIGINDSLRIEDLTTGEHTLELGDLAFNCNTVGFNPLDFSISASDPLELTFEVTCIILPGALQIRTFTLGDAPGTDQYLIQVDGGDQHTIEEEGAIAFGVPPGEHQLFLDGVPAECTIEGANPLLVTVAPNETLRITFSITCP